MSTADVALKASGVTHRYGERLACDDLSFEVGRGCVQGFLGPNGSGKSTLFKILATSYPLQQGEVSMLGMDLRNDVARIRPVLGVVFQSPALDKKLTVRENLVYGGHLYGLRGAELRSRIDEGLDRSGLRDRAADRVDDLSGGLRRRVELAKGLLSRPQLLLLDEPSTGLDPGARADLWRFLRALDDVTVLFTTHYLEEGEHADRIAILSQGRMVAAGAPADLVREIGEQVLEITARDPAALEGRIAERFGCKAVVLEHSLRIEKNDAHRLVPELVEAFGDEIDRISVSHPSLEDVYIAATGHRFWGESGEPAEPGAAKKAKR